MLSAEFAAVFIHALQWGPDTRYKRIISVVKHIAAYDIEDLRPTGVPITRFNFDAVVPLSDLVSYYLVPFKAATQRGLAGGLMCSYNAVNGIPMCANGFVNNVIVREQWGWDGFTISDCSAFSLLCSPSCYSYNLGHNYTQTLNAAVGVAVGGGMDAACDKQFGPAVVPALANRSVTLSQLQTAATRVLRQFFAAGLLDPPGSSPYFSYGMDRVDTPASRQLALEAAQQAVVLLKNDAATLPLRRAALKRLAVVGPNANATLGLLSNYHGNTPVVSSRSILLALQREGAAAGFDVAFAPGCATLGCADESGFPAALAAVTGADAAVVVLGLCSQVCEHAGDDVHGVKEEEMYDRTSLLLPGLQEELLRAVSATGVPTILVLVRGGPLDVSWAAEHVGAILDAQYPGEMGGDAIASILFGDVSPSGRLTTTVYREAFLAARNVTDMALAPHGDVPGITHLYLNASSSPELVLYPFGYGLSYTSFAFDWADGAAAVTVDAGKWGREGAAALPPFAVNVTNTGLVPSSVSALAFAYPADSAGPLEVLFDFQRAANLAPGATVTLFFAAPPEPFALATPYGVLSLTPRRFQLCIGEAGNCATRDLVVTGDATISS